MKTRPFQVFRVTMEIAAAELVDIGFFAMIGKCTKWQQTARGDVGDSKCINQRFDHNYEKIKFFCSILFCFNFISSRWVLFQMVENQKFRKVELTKTKLGKREVSFQMVENNKFLI